MAWLHHAQLRVHDDMLTGDHTTFVLGGFAAAAGVVWLCAGIAKFRQPLTRSDLAALAQPLARLHPVLRWAVPGVEVAIGLALVSGMQARPAAVAGTLLGAAFALLHVVAMVRAGLSDAPLPRRCGCFGRADAAPVPSSLPASDARTSNTLDDAAITARSWQWAEAATLTIVTWTATLPCGLCGR
jgi:hypothetical protein